MFMIKTQSGCLFITWKVSITAPAPSWAFLVLFEEKTIFPTCVIQNCNAKGKMKIKCCVTYEDLLTILSFCLFLNFFFSDMTLNYCSRSWLGNMQLTQNINIMKFSLWREMKYVCQNYLQSTGPSVLAVYLHFEIWLI